MTKKTPPEQRRYLSVREVAAELGVGPHSVYRFIYSGDLKAGNFGTGSQSVLRVSRAQLDEFCSRREREAAERFGATT